jgi:hypothetical protein
MPRDQRGWEIRHSRPSNRSDARDAPEPKKGAQPLAKLHITQDDHGYWMLSHEGDDGALTLVGHQFQTPTKPLEMAQELIAEGRFQGQIVMDPPREASADAAARAAAAPGEYVTPTPRKAGA